MNIKEIQEICDAANRSIAARKITFKEGKENGSKFKRH